jgi:16S rRNA (adenine1518-N6/adenine1519-N6)-dimethyltransferase
MRPRKRFGQHFLHDTAILQAIADAMALAPQQRVFEIGPGQGGRLPNISIGLICSVTWRLKLISDLAPLLPAKFPGIEVLQQDILRTDMVAVLGEDAQPTQTDERGLGEWSATCPDNISSPLLMQLIDVVLAQPHSIKDMHFMLQKEMAERLSAVPGF